MTMCIGSASCDAGEAFTATLPLGFASPNSGLINGFAGSVAVMLAVAVSQAPAQEQPRRASASAPPLTSASSLSRSPPVVPITNGSLFSPAAARTGGSRRGGDTTARGGGSCCPDTAVGGAKRRRNVGSANCSEQTSSCDKEAHSIMARCHSAQNCMHRCS